MERQWLHKASSLEAFLSAPVPAVPALLGPVSQCSAPAQAKMIDASATKQTPVWPGKDGLFIPPTPMVLVPKSHMPLCAVW